MAVRQRRHHCDWLMGGCLVQDGDGVRKIQRLARRAPGAVPAADVEVIDTWYGGRAARHRQPRHRGRRAGGARSRTGVAGDRPAASRRRRCTPSRCSACWRWGSPPWRWGSRAARVDEMVGLAAAQDAAVARAAPWPSAPACRPRWPAPRHAGRARRAPCCATAGGASGAGRAGRARCRVEHRGRACGGRDPRRRAPRRPRSRPVQAGGGSAIYESSPLQRRCRDVHVATQHMIVGPATWELAGRVLLGLEPGTAQL